MDFLRNKRKLEPLSNKTELFCQINDWNCYDEFPDADEEDEGYDQYKDNANYVIQIFGVLENDTSISIKVKGFKPRFFINIPKKWDDKRINIFVNFLKDKVKKRYKESIFSHKVVYKHKFRGFTNNEEFKFLRLAFNNKIALNQYARVLQKKVYIPSLNKKKKKYELYESNIEPFIRFIHIQDIKPSGWIKLQAKKYKKVAEKLTNCQYEVEIHWKNIYGYERNEILPLLISAYDIECDSAHGDFPLAKKNYKKLSNEIIDNISKKRKKYLTNKEEKKKSTELLVGLFELKDNEIRNKFLKDLISIGFNDDNDADNKNFNRIQNEKESISFLYTKENVKPSVKEIDKFINRISFIAFKGYNKIGNNKELNKAVNETREIWAGQTIEMLETIATNMGRKHELSRDKIIKRIITRDLLVDKMTEIFDEYFPELEGDKVIQIGTTINRYGEDECFLKHIVTLNTCDAIEGVEVVQCKTEKEVIIEWFKFIRDLDPDIITGYNIFGFDYAFIYERAEELDCIHELGSIGRIKYDQLELIEKNLSSSALGENILKYFKMPGRVCMDLLKNIQKDYKLGSYKLDTVAETFINGSIQDIKIKKSFMELVLNSTNDLQIGNYITIFLKNDKYMEGKKFKILDIKNNSILLDKECGIAENLVELNPSWRLAKDDIGPKDIFRLQKGNSEDRAIVATYCIQDCVLCNKLVSKLSVVANNIGMANVCFVPLSYIFLRGQGVKIFSLVSRVCREQNYLLPVLKKPLTDEELEEHYDKISIGNVSNNNDFDSGYDDSDEDEIDTGGYEGAIVLQPNPGLYLNKYVTVLDYSSLYPSSMISENLSHDTYVMDEKYDNLPGYKYKDITYDVFEWIDFKKKSKGKKKVGEKTCRFVQLPNGKKGIIPETLKKLLKSRKDTRKKILYKTVTDLETDKTFDGLMEEIKNEEEKVVKIILKNVEGIKMEFIYNENRDNLSIKDTYNDFEKDVLDGLQLAYKITANSLYGQIGARTSPIYLKDIAASTTATGRRLLYLAKDKILENFEGSEIVYGDTDSVFINFNPRDEDGNLLTGKAGLKKSIELGVKAEKFVQPFLLPPHKLEYEKTFYPFILFTKKRYIGNKYEFDLDKFKQTSMGIVLKRRDNANIVKHIYGGIMNILMKERDIKKSIKFLKEEMIKLVAGKFDLDMLTVTKSLKSYYKSPDTIAHKVLADRIGEREPGNKPLPSDRIPYIYIEYKEKRGEKKLQGDKIETPRFIIENNLKPDYLTYITNQIQKPVCQIYALIVEELEGFKYDKNYFNDMEKRLLQIHDKSKVIEKINKKKNDVVKDILFSDVIREGTNKKNKIKPITAWFKPA